jgi:hypothetical protein
MGLRGLFYGELYLHSYIPQSYDRSTASFKASSPHSAIQCFPLKFTVSLLSVKSSSSCLRLLPRLRVPSLLFPYLSFSNMFQKTVPTQDVTNPVSLPSIYYMYDIPLLLDSV